MKIRVYFDLSFMLLLCILKTMESEEFKNQREKIELILKNALPQSYGESWIKDSFGNVPSSVMDCHLDFLAKPCRELVLQGGKRWRPLLLVLTAEISAKANILRQAEKEIAIENAYNLTPLLEFVHTASLIHDDIEDNASMRRGKKAAHITYGVDTAINSGSWLYFEAASCINKINATNEVKKNFYDLYATELRRLHLGQAMDILWHRNPELFPSVEEYNAMVRLKTGTLSSLATKIGVLSGAGTVLQADKAGVIASDIGAGFQILDDVQNLTTGNPGKKRGDDIVEGKKSLPVLLHLKKYPSSKNEIASFFEKASKEGINSSAVEDCINLLEKGGCIKEAFTHGKELVTTKSIELANTICKTDDTKDSEKNAITLLFTNMLPKNN